MLVIFTLHTIFHPKCIQFKQKKQQISRNFTIFRKFTQIFHRSPQFTPKYHNFTPNSPKSLAYARRERSLARITTPHLAIHTRARLDARS